MIGDNDENIFLNANEFARLLSLPNGVQIKGILQSGEDQTFGGLVEARQLALVISHRDYLANENLLSRGSSVVFGQTTLRVERFSPYGEPGDFHYGILELAV